MGVKRERQLSSMAPPAPTTPALTTPAVLTLSPSPSPSPSWSPSPSPSPSPPEPSAASSITSSSSSSSSGDGESPFESNSMAPHEVGENAASLRSDASFDYYGYAGDDSSGSASSASGSGGDDNGTISALDLLPKELRKGANRTRPDSDIPWTSEDETCYYHEMADDRCFHPRSCQQCLEKPGCMINQLGQCVNQVVDQYNGFMDFRAAITKNLSGPHATNLNASHTQQYHFPAQVVPYCPADEPTCKYCKRNDFKAKIDSRFCLGRYKSRKCVCVSICESPVRNQLLVHMNCTNPLSTNTLANEIGHPLMSTPSLFTVIVAPIVLIFVAYQVVKRHKRSRSGSDDTIVGAPRSGDADGDGDAADSVWSWSTATTAQEAQNEQLHPTGRLDLFGWQAQRQEMIAKEQLLLAGLEEASPSGGFVDFDTDTDPSAPGGETFAPSSAPMESAAALQRASAPPSNNAMMLDDDGASPSAPVMGGNDYQTMDHMYWNESELAML